jgi:hypothetical protein
MSTRRPGNLRVLVVPLGLSRQMSEYCLKLGQGRLFLHHFDLIMAKGLGLTAWVQFPAEARDFLFSTAFRTVLEPT